MNIQNSDTVVRTYKFLGGIILQPGQNTYADNSIINDEDFQAEVVAGNITILNYNNKGSNDYRFLIKDEGAGGGGAGLTKVQFAYKFGVPANETQALFEESGTSIAWPSPYTAPIMAMYAYASDPISTGSITLEPRINGSDTGETDLDLVLNNANQTRKATLAEAVAALTLTADDTLGIFMTTSADLDPETLDITVDVWIQPTVGE